MDEIEQGHAAPTIAQAHSDALVAHIKSTIAAHSGWIDFAQYMQLCLYTPSLGYYTGGSHKIGLGGDFTTAPELTPLFGQSIAQHIRDVAHQLGEFDVLEFGAGSGKLAADILLQLEKDECLPRHYYILEVSSELQDRQQSYLQQHCPQFFDRIHWLDALPKDFEGVILANEVCDAMPVHRVRLTENDNYEVGISVQNDQLVWDERRAVTPELMSHINNIRTLAAPHDYITEINLLAGEWIQTIGQLLKQGAVFVFDYGYDAAQFYRPERTDGTFRCYYQQKAVDAPLLRPGLQDITAHVNFTALAESALTACLSVSSYQEQSDFLLAGGITELAQCMQESLEESEWLSQSAAMKQLMLPSGMGHQFKVLSLTKELELLPRLSVGDRRYQL